MKLRIFAYGLVAVTIAAALVLSVIGVRIATSDPLENVLSSTTGDSISTSHTTQNTTIPSGEDDTTIPVGPSSTEPPPTQPPATQPPLTEPPATQPPTTQPPPTKPTPTEPQNVFPKLSAKTAFVYDSRSNDYLYCSGEKDKAIYPASTTKLFTTYVALRYLQPETVVTVGEELDYLSEGASAAGLKKGDMVTVEATVKCALLPSGCDASYVLAAAAGRMILQDENATADAAVQAFMDKVNEMAEQMGMTNTHFVNPDGYHHKDHKISVEGFVIIAKCCMEDPLISQVAGSATAQVSVTDDQGKTRQITLKNTNENLNPKSKYYTDACLGLKTGYTSKAGVCLLGTYQVEGGYLIIGVFGCPTLESRYPDVLALLKYFG